MQLRPYQQQAISDLRNAFRSGARAPLLVAPTGAGKTIILAAIASSAVARDRQVLILVHRRELIRQASSKLTAAGVRHGVLAAGFPTTPASVQLASVQTLNKRLQWCDHNPSLIIIDEAHHAVSRTWAQLLRHWPDAYRLGVTATPCRLDGRGLGAAFDALVMGPSVQMLTSAGYLAPARIYAPPMVANLAGIRKRAGDYAVGESAAAMDRPSVTGDAISHYQRFANGQQAIAFCCNIAHADSVAKSFNAAGIKAATLLGGHRPKLRDQTVADFAAGHLQVLVTVDVVSEGFDIPAAGCAILLRPTQSLSLYMQQVGRVLRPAPGKDAAIILDHVGNVNRHGFPDDHRQWSLEEGIRRSNSGPAAPSVRTCPACFAAFKPAPICPVCGHEQPTPKMRVLRQVDGDLKEITKQQSFKTGDPIAVKSFDDDGEPWVEGWAFGRLYEEERNLGRARCYDPSGKAWSVSIDDIRLAKSELARQRRTEQGRAQTLQQLIAVGHARNMRNPVAWAKHVLYARSLKNGQRRDRPAATHPPSAGFEI